MLLAFRFLTGFIGSPCLVTGGASIVDMYIPEKAGYPISLWGIAAGLRTDPRAAHRNLRNPE